MSSVALLKAFVKAQSEFSPIPKDGRNKHLGNSYATLDNIIAKVRPVLFANGLGFYQVTVNGEEGSIGVETVLVHESGETLTIPAFFVKPVKADPQGAGSALTYAKRYSLSACLGISSDSDDDGHGASVSVPVEKPKKVEPKAEKPVLSVEESRAAIIKAAHAKGVVFTKAEQANLDKTKDPEEMKAIYKGALEATRAIENNQRDPADDMMGEAS